MSEIGVAEQPKAFRLSSNGLERAAPLMLERAPKEPKSFYSGLIDQLEQRVAKTGQDNFIVVGKKEEDKDSRMVLLKGSAPAKNNSQGWRTHLLITPDGLRRFSEKPTDVKVNQRSQDQNIEEIFQYYSDPMKLTLRKSPDGTDVLRYQEPIGLHPKEISIYLRTPSIEQVKEVLKNSYPLGEEQLQIETIEDLLMSVMEQESKKEAPPPSTADSSINSAGALVISDLKRVAPEKSRSALRFFLKPALTTTALAEIISAACGNVEKQTPPPLTPTAVVSELPTGMPSQVEFERLVTPTAEPTPLPSPTSAMETPVGIEQPADVESRFKAAGMETFLPFYMQASEIMNKYRADLTYFDVVNVSNAVAKGEIVDRDNPRLIEIRDGWGSEKDHAVEKALEHVNNIIIKVDSNAEDDPEEVREKLLRPFARSFAPLAKSIPNELWISASDEGFSQPDSLMAPTLKTTAGLNMALPTFWHEVNHSADQFPARLKSLVSKEAYLDYIRSYFQISDALLTRWFSIDEEEKGLEFWWDTGGYSWAPQIGQALSDRNTLSNELATEFFGKSPSETNNPLLFEWAAWHTGRRIMDIRGKQSRQESLTSQEHAFLEDPRVKKLMGEVLYETIHFLVRPYEDFVESSEEYEYFRQKGFLSEAQEQIHKVRVATFATFPIDPDQDIRSQIRQQFGLKPVTIQPTETPTPTVEIHQPKVISLGGSVEPDPTSLSAGETIKLVFPEGILDGESPLIPEGDTLSVYLKLNSVKGIRIRECSLSISDLLGIKNNKSSVIINPTDASATADIASTIRSFQRIANFSVSDDDQKIIEKIKFTCLQSSNEGVVVNLSLPNESFTYTDKDGSHLVNPAERYVSGKVGLGINRGNIAIGRFALTAEDIKIENGKGKLVATADRFDITPPRTPVPTRPPETTQVPVKPPIPTIQATETPTPEPKEEENKWTGREWAPNETVPIQEWWNDMVLKEHISIDAIAQQYAGEQINNFLKGANLVPNPVQYYKQGHGFINNCNLELDKLVNQGQGHIKITHDAYAQIPGAAECQIFTKDK